MTEIERTLEEERRIINAATAGPWIAEWHGEDWWYSIYGAAAGEEVLPEVATLDDRESKADAKFIAHARTALPLRSAQVEAVLSIHRPVEVEPSATICSGCSTRRGTFPDFRYFPVVEYPCETVRAIEEAGA